MPEKGSSSFETTLSNYRETLLIRARNRTRDYDVAEDLVQETLLRAYTAQPQFTPGSNLHAWLFRILDHLICDQYRQEAQTLEVLSWEDLPPGMEALVTQYASLQEQPETAFLAPIFSPEMERALQALSPNLRRILWMTAIDELSPQDIATCLGLEVGAVKMRLSRARQQARQVFKQAHQGQEAYSLSLQRS